MRKKFTKSRPYNVSIECPTDLEWLFNLTNRGPYSFVLIFRKSTQNLCSFVTVFVSVLFTIFVNVFSHLFNNKNIRGTGFLGGESSSPDTFINSLNLYDGFFSKVIYNCIHFTFMKAANNSIDCSF